MPCSGKVGWQSQVHRGVGVGFCLFWGYRDSGISRKLSYTITLSCYWVSISPLLPVGPWMCGLWDWDGEIGSSRPRRHHFHSSICADGDIFWLMNVGTPQQNLSNLAPHLLRINPQRKDGLFSLQVARWFSVPFWEKGILVLFGETLPRWCLYIPRGKWGLEF